MSVFKRWGFINETRKEVIPCIYEETLYFSEGLAAVQLNGKMGFIDKIEKEIIPCIYEYLDTFAEGLARAILNSKQGYIDKTGKTIIPFIYETLGGSNFYQGFASVKLNGKYYKINKKGEIVK